MTSKFANLSALGAYATNNYGRRIVRLICHLLPISTTYYLPATSIKEWIYDLGAYMADLIFLPEIYQSIRILVSTSIHKLSEEDRYQAQTYFGQSIDLHQVMIYPTMSKWIRKRAHAYVTFNTINYYRHISTPILMHELVHIWQYQRFGSMYIFRALSAQRSKDGYDYGGVEALYLDMMNQKQFWDFNFEQQGSIVEDYARVLLAPQLQVSPMAIATYEYFISQIKEP